MYQKFKALKYKNLESLIIRKGKNRIEPLNILVKHF